MILGWVWLHFSVFLRVAVLHRFYRSGLFTLNIGFLFNRIPSSMSISSFIMHSKTCLKRPLKNRQSKVLRQMVEVNEGRKYYRMLQELQESILQYFWPALSKNRSWKSIFGVLFEWLLKTGFTVCKLSLSMTKPTNWLHPVMTQEQPGHCTQQWLRAVWSSYQSDNSPHWVHEERFGP